MTDKNTFSGVKFKAFGRVSKSRFMPKVVSHRMTVPDAYDGRFRSSLHMFIPKLTPKHIKPCVMLHVSNGSSSCLIRCDKEELLRILDDFIVTLRSDRWIELMFELDDRYQKLQTGMLPIIDETLMDINEWTRELENRCNIDAMTIEHELEDGHLAEK